MVNRSGIGTVRSSKRVSI